MKDIEDFSWEGIMAYLIAAGIPEASLRFREEGGGLPAAIIAQCYDRSSRLEGTDFYTRGGIVWVTERMRLNRDTLSIRRASERFVEYQRRMS